MIVDDAYEIVLQTIQELEDSGIKVSRKPSNSRENKDVVEMYNLPNRLLPDKWIHISFHIKTDEQRAEISQARKGLGWRGIYFDTGAGYRLVDWELDWSFYVEDVPNADREMMADIVDDLIKNMKWKD